MKYNINNVRKAGEFSPLAEQLSQIVLNASLERQRLEPGQ